MEQMLSTNQAEELSAIRQSCKARQRYAQIQMIALVAMAAVVIAFVLLLMPRASAALAQVDAVVGELASVDFAGMAERVDVLVREMAEAEGVDEEMKENEQMEWVKWMRLLHKAAPAWRRPWRGWIQALPICTVHSPCWRVWTFKA